MKRLNSVHRGEPFSIIVDGEAITAYPGEWLATALLTAGKLFMRRTFKSGSLRSYYCGMGLCNECLVTLADGTESRACQTAAEAGMKISTLQEDDHLTLRKGGGRS